MTIRKKFLLVIWGVAHLAFPVWAASELQVAPDARVDLISLVFHCVGASEFSQFFLPGYEDAANARLARLREHPVVSMAREFRRQHGVSYNAIPDLALRLIPNELQLIEGTLDSLDPRWPRDQLEKFLIELRDFAKRSHFSEIYETQLPAYRTECELWSEIIKCSGVSAWAERFYGKKRPLHFIVVPSALENGGTGCSVEIDGEFYCYMISRSDRLTRNASTLKQLPVLFPQQPEIRKMVELKQEVDVNQLLAHEFSHTWTNPVMEAIYPQIQSTAERFFLPLREMMGRQAYGTPRTMMIETLNRAVVLVYLHDRYGEEIIPERIKTEQYRGFWLVERLYCCILAEREKGGTSWHFADGAQAYANCINAAESQQVLEAFSRAKQNVNAPSILSFSPPNGAKNVDPATDELVVVFSKPMKASMAICTAGRGAVPSMRPAIPI